MSSKRGVVFEIQIELIAWLAITCIVGIRIIHALTSGMSKFIFEYYYLDLLLTLIVFLFPYLFKLIYTEFPFQSLREKRIDRIIEKSKSKIYSSREISITQNKLYSHEGKMKFELDIIKEYQNQAEKLATQIYSRSSVYLLIGCLIAFGGVGFFYFQSISLFKDTDSKLLSSELMYTFHQSLPRIGILIFVEAIAFFFLKQYKSTMEEFRYYESIKRQRENQYLVTHLAQSYQDNSEYFEKLVTQLKLNDNPNKLFKEESTQVLENQKLSAQESDVVDKFIDLLKIVKK